jgi:hypothetical protein
VRALSPWERVAEGRVRAVCTFRDIDDFFVVKSATPRHSVMTRDTLTLAASLLACSVVAWNLTATLKPKESLGWRL